MLIQVRAGTLIPALAFAAILLLAPSAGAVACIGDHLVAFNDTFTDCAGN